MFQLTLKREEREFLKSLEILDEMDSEDTNIYAPNIIDRFENCQYNLDDMCLADFIASCTYWKGWYEVSKNDIYEKCCIKPVAEIQEEEDLKTEITRKLKNSFGKTEKKNSINCDKISHF